MTESILDWKDRVISTPDVLGGSARIKGTRIPISVILDNLASGESWNDIIANYPNLTEEDISAVISYASYIQQRSRVKFVHHSE